MENIKTGLKRIYNNIVIALIITVIFLNGIVAISQTNDSITKPKLEFPNSIKFNLTNIILYDKAYQISYERLIKENQSVTLFVGYQEFPNIGLEVDNVNFSASTDRSGFSIGSEYRFYLGKINKYSAPRGVYLAPFVSYFQFNTSRELTYTGGGSPQTATLDTDINFINVGGELGYQFVIGKRWVIDCVLFGPSLSFYKFEAKLDNNIDGLDENELAQKIIEKLKEKIPLLNDFESGDTATKSGAQRFEAVGFRYNISIGYRF